MPTIETNGVETYYERSGKGLPVVFINGLGLDHRLWKPQFAELAGDFEVVAYDYRGQGETGPTDRSEYSIGLLAEDLRALIEGLELEQPVLCAHSYGGLIAGEYAVQYPDDVAGIVFADARTDFGENFFERAIVPVEPWLHRLQELIGEERVQEAMEFVAARFQDMEEGEDLDEEVPELEMTPREYFEATDLANEEQRKLTRAGLEYVGTQPTDFIVPVLYAYGERTGKPIKGKADRLRRAPADVRVEEFENAGHGHTLEQADQFTELLRDFLRDIESEAEVTSSDADD